MSATSNTVYHHNDKHHRAVDSIHKSSVPADTATTTTIPVQKNKDDDEGNARKTQTASTVTLSSSSADHNHRPGMKLLYGKDLLRENSSQNRNHLHPHHQDKNENETPPPSPHLRAVLPSSSPNNHFRKNYQINNTIVKKNDSMHILMPSTSIIHKNNHNRMLIPLLPKPQDCDGSDDLKRHSEHCQDLSTTATTTTTSATTRRCLVVTPVAELGGGYPNQPANVNSVMNNDKNQESSTSSPIAVSTKSLPLFEKVESSSSSKQPPLLSTAIHCIHDNTKEKLEKDDTSFGNRGDANHHPICQEPPTNVVPKSSSLTSNEQMEKTQHKDPNILKNKMMPFQRRTAVATGTDASTYSMAAMVSNPSSKSTPLPTILKRPQCVSAIAPATQQSRPLHFKKRFLSAAKKERKEHSSEENENGSDQPQSFPKRRRVSFQSPVSSV
jgi:hypothetical protein